MCTFLSPSLFVKPYAHTPTGPFFRYIFQHAFFQLFFHLCITVPAFFHPLFHFLFSILFCTHFFSFFFFFPAALFNDATPYCRFSSSPDNTRIVQDSALHESMFFFLHVEKKRKKKRKLFLPSHFYATIENVVGGE